MNTERIIVVGSGVVGSATGRGFAAHGHRVRFVDIDAGRIDALRRDGFEAGRDIGLDDVPAIIFLTLPTPNDGHEWKLDALVAGTQAVARELASSSAFHTVVTRSTVPPGTTEDLVRPVLEEVSGGRVGIDFALASNPEFLRAEYAYEDFINPWMTVVASRSNRTVERLERLLAPFGGELRTFSDPAQTEFIKCAHNIFNATKISFWNEMWQVAGRIGIDPDVTADVVSRSAEGSFNTSYGIRGGRPYGGACLPKDTKGFLGFASGIGMEMPLLRAVDEVNEAMAAAVATPDVLARGHDGQRAAAVSAN
jgi:UDPglucose 6-dehydrogenase